MNNDYMKESFFHKIIGSNNIDNSFIKQSKNSIENQKLKYTFNDFIKDINENNLFVKYDEKIQLTTIKNKQYYIVKNISPILNLLIIADTSFQNKNFIKNVNIKMNIDVFDGDCLTVNNNNTLDFFDIKNVKKLFEKIIKDNNFFDVDLRKPYIDFTGYGNFYKTLLKIFNNDNDFVRRLLTMFIKNNFKYNMLFPVHHSPEDVFVLYKMLLIQDIIQLDNGFKMNEHKKSRILYKLRDTESSIINFVLNHNYFLPDMIFYVASLKSFSYLTSKLFIPNNYNVHSTEIIEKIKVIERIEKFNKKNLVNYNNGFLGDNNNVDTVFLKNKFVKIAEKLNNINNNIHNDLVVELFYVLCDCCNNFEVYDDYVRSSLVLDNCLSIICTKNNVDYIVNVVKMLMNYDNDDLCNVSAILSELSYHGVEADVHFIDFLLLYVDSGESFSDVVKNFLK